MVGQRVGVAGAGRKVPREVLAHGVDGAHEALAGFALGNVVRQVVDDGLPLLLGHPLVDRGIGHDLGVALGHRDEDQHAGASRSGVEVLGQELLHGAPVRALMLHRARHQRQAQGLVHEEQDEGGKDEGLQGVDVLDRPPGPEDQRKRHRQRGERRPHERHVEVA